MLNKILFILFILFIGVCEVQTFNPPPEEKGEHLIVNYSSEGCFHHWAYTLDFHKDEVTIYKSMTKWYQKKPVDEKLGKVTLSEEDHKQLEKLFAYYDKKHSNGCTTTEIIEIRHYRERQLISLKKIKDASCGLYEGENILSFLELISRVEKE